MVETAAHLTDHVFPRLPVRQWVLSVPKRLRYFMQRDGAVLNMVLRIFLRVIAQRLQSNSPGAAQVDKAAQHIGAVAFIHRFGSSLKGHVHFHVCAVDGVFEEVPGQGDADADAQSSPPGIVFHPASAIDETAVAQAQTDWAYEGENGPQAWGKLKPEFNVCAIGKRQSPINIEEGNTLLGPAEPVQFTYVPSNGTVVNNGHTIQVDVQGDNSITVGGSNYRLLQFHFHTPSEEQINFKRFPMVAHLVHKNNEGQLAVVAVLLQDGESSPLIDKVWTYMPLDSGDRVRLPQGLLDVNELLPKDQRYYQFMGSLTTPPCTEGVLWMVMKQPVTLSKGQYKLFTQLYPNNARPVQPVNGRPVREAQ